MLSDLSSCRWVTNLFKHNIDCSKFLGQQRASVLPVLVEIPTVAVEIFKNNHRSVLFLTRFLAEMNPFCLHSVVVAPEIVSLQEQEHSAAALVTNKTLLPLV